MNYVHIDINPAVTLMDMIREGKERDKPQTPGCIAERRTVHTYTTTGSTGR